MSYCTLDEAFGSPYLSGQENNYDKCVKRSKVRRKKINCNEKKSRFNSNLPDVKLNSYNPKKHTSELLNSNNNAFSYFPAHVEQFENFSNMENSQDNNVTSFALNNENSGNNKNNSGNTRNTRNNRNNSKNNSRNNSKNNSRNNRNNRKEPNEIFEYSEEDNLPMNNSSDYEVVNSSEEGESTDAVDNEYQQNEYEENINHNQEIEIVNNSPNNLLTSQISEINNKISFIMNQMNKGDSNEIVGEENNMHDIILFIIFGIFVLLILESFYKMISKVLRAKHGMNINLS
jgi:hypothetical protein